ncbi:MAG: amino acid adenylation domain-containing protein, partial [bacterium]|nr:amino acid adenylation domain-containing protein [bacterium]
SEQTFTGLLKQVRRTTLEAFSHQDIPFEYLVEQLNPSRSLSHSPLFQVMLVLQNAPEEELKPSGLNISFPKPEYATAKFDLTLSVTEQVDGFICNWEYSTDLFRPDTITRMIEHFQVLLEGILDDPEQLISQLPLLTEAETHQFLAWNQTETDYPLTLKEAGTPALLSARTPGTIVDLFQQQVEKTPDHVAIVFEDRQLSYLELNTKANPLAHYLIESGVGPGTLVGLCCRRSLEMVTGVLGTLKAGGAYVPLDPDYPLSRLQFMLEDSSAPVMLSQSHLSEGLPLSTVKTVCLDDQPERMAAGSVENPIGQSEPDHPAYVIYTSGSTGQPKGVMVQHRNLLAMLYGFERVAPVEYPLRGINVSSFSFDVSVWEFFINLCFGGTLHLVDSELLINPASFADYLHSRQINCTYIPPALLAPVANELETRPFGVTLQRLLIGVEPIKQGLMQRYRNLSSKLNIINGYGPTETTISATFYSFIRADESESRIPIGKPLQGYRVYVLDSNLQPGPVGIPGELCIAGAGLARGYLNRPEITAEKFIEIEVFGKAQRLYKSGDLVRWLTGGNIEFLGRIDHQVKLRGFRIELSEIEVTLGRHDAVKEAVLVLYNQDDNPRLIAYVTLLMPVDEAVGVLREWLKNRLPEYMVPAGFMVLDKLPLTPNGKIDRNALPYPALSVQAEHQAPGTETEHLLCNFWSLVLGVEVTGIDNNFFESGGHSLLATQLVSRIRESFEIEMPLQVVFERPVLREQAQWLDNQQRGSELPPITPLAEGSPLVLSFAQQRLWFLAQLEGQSAPQGQSASYNMPAALHLEGQLNITALQHTLTALIQRHYSLRLCFPAVDGEATAQLNDVYNPLNVINLNECSESEQQHRVTEWITKHTQTPFDLSAGPLLSVLLLKLGKQDHMLLFNMHHIISDGWSMGVLIREWSLLYNAYAQKPVAQTAQMEEPVLPEPVIQYTDYAAWQRGWLEGDVLEQQLEYWTLKLTGVPELLELPTDYPRPAVMSYRGNNLQRTLNQELTREIKQLSRRQGVTVFMTLLAAFNVLLSRYSGQTDLVVGCPIANRTHHQTEGLIGFFLNTLVLRNHINGAQTFSEFLKQVRQTALEAYSRQDIPFEYLVEQINPSRSLSHSPLFQVLLVLQNTPQETLELQGLKMSFPESVHTTAKYDLTLNITEQDECFVCNWQYNTDLFRTDTITRMSEHFQVLLEGILYPESGLTLKTEPLISQLPLLTEADKHQLLVWNQTETDYPKNQTVVDLFQAQVKNVPDNIAVVFEDQQLSYLELDTRANQLAHYLMTLGVRPGTLVGICIERSLEMLTGFWGILKAGGAYVPLDPYYPVSRLQFMVEDFSTPVILSQSYLLEQLPTSTAKMVCLDSQWKQISDCSGENPPIRRSGPENLAYVIYTSGSTGMPKGVMIDHSALSNHMQWMQGTFPLFARDTVLQKAPFNFDASVWEFCASLQTGGVLVMAKPGGHQDPEYLTAMLLKNQVTALRVVPSLLLMLLNTKGFEHCIALRYLFCSGESITGGLRQAFYNTNLPARFYNFYGPTETTIITTDWFCDKKTVPISIGRPIANTQIYILDTHDNQTPPGIPGELCIAGTGLARGYLNRPELTHEKFEVRTSHVALYKTGDLARWLPDGNLEFLGRLDHQVKLRGFRIELSEIEVLLSRQETVKEAVVILNYQDDNPRLVAYVTLDGEDVKMGGLEDGNTIEILKEWLKDRLPEYMVPAGFMVLDKLPLKPNGKIDRNALPEPALSAHDLVIRDEQQMSRTETEDLLCNLWSQVLGVEVTSINSHFFESGGHSLLATQLISRIRESFEIKIPLRMIFEHPVLIEQAELLDKQQRGSALPRIMPLPENEPLVLSFAQQRLWFLAQLEGRSATYNMSAALHLEGPLDVTALDRSLTALIQRHHSLRLCFPTVNGEAAVQLNDVYNPLSVIDLSEDSETGQQHRVTEWITKHAQKHFDLNTGPLLSVCLLILDNEEQVLLFNMHHIISDGWSMGVLIREWVRLYNAYSQKWVAPTAQEEEPVLPEPAIQYTDYAAWQRSWLEGDVLERQLEYWTRKLSGAPELLELPTDYPRPAVMSYRGNLLETMLDPELTQRIKQLSREQGVTIYMTLLAALNVLLSRYSGQTDIVVGSPIANRTHHHTEDLIGFFVNTLVLRNQLNGEQTFSEVLKQVRQTALGAYGRQDIPFEYLVEQLNPSRSLSHSPLFQVVLALQNARGEALELNSLKISFPESVNTTAKFDLILNIVEQGDGLGCNWEYNTDLFRPDTITRMIGHFRILLEGILDNPDETICQLPLLTEAEKQQFLAWNHPESGLTLSPVSGPTISKTVVDLFRDQVEKTPDNIAVVFEDQQLSYRELNTRSNRLAHYLIESGVGPDLESGLTSNLVGICVERSLEMTVGVLAILKAGGAYVPLDPNYPPARLQFMIEDSSMPVLLTQGHLQERLPTSAAKIVCLDTDWNPVADGAGNRENLSADINPGNLAYVIFTSGTTGRPKGILLRHRGLCNLIIASNKLFNVHPQSRVLQFAAFGFDVSVWETFMALTSGAALCLARRETLLSLPELIDMMRSTPITMALLAPSLLQVLPSEDLPELETIISVGEKCTAEVVRKWAPGRCLFNGYGPAEASVTVSAHLTSADEDMPQGPSIGVPLDNVRLYVLDKSLQSTPVGVPGELHIGGVYLARGYLNNPELTGRKFISNPLDNEPGARLYKTGDLARYLPDGKLQFVGRVDNQIKLRGFRIELGEIESTLRRHEAVEEAVVVLYRKDDKP